MDDCVAAAFSGSDAGEPNWPKTGLAVFNKQAWQGNTYLYSESYFTRAPDGSCVNLTTEPTYGTDICLIGELGWESSPISLIWEQGYDVDSAITVVRFPLQLNSPKPFSLWKSSAKAPLLVFDPEHIGKITSAAQLFGNWTFGGKRFASLSSVAGTPNSQWRDGFEALATLDTNGDGKISGTELEPLALWFDANQNGVAEEGEVKSLADLGIVALYYKADFTEAATHNIVARLGYERVVAGKIVRGSAVDWYSDGASSPDEIMQRHLTHQAFCRETLNVTLANGSEEFPKDPQQVVAATAKIPNDRLSGAWNWKSQDPKFRNANAEIAPAGIFTFKTLPDGKVQGHSYIEITPRPNDKFTNMLMITKVAGLIQTEKEGSQVIRFRTQLRNGRIISSAKLLDEGTRLEGRSVATITYRGKLVSIDYDWTATRRMFSTPVASR